MNKKTMIILCIIIIAILVISSIVLILKNKKRIFGTDILDGPGMENIIVTENNEYAILDEKGEEIIIPETNPVITEVISPENTEEKVKKEYTKLIKYNDHLYAEAYIDEDFGEKGVYADEIKTTVDSKDVPQNNLESNFGTGYKILYVSEDSIAINIEDKVHIFIRQK